MASRAGAACLTSLALCVVAACASSRAGDDLQLRVPASDPSYERAAVNQAALEWFAAQSVSPRAAVASVTRPDSTQPACAPTRAESVTPAACQVAIDSATWRSYRQHNRKPEPVRLSGGLPLQFRDAGRAPRDDEALARWLRDYEKGLIVFSGTGLRPDGTEAVTALSYTCGAGCGSAAQLLLRKEGGTWKVVTALGTASFQPKPGS